MTGYFSYKLGYAAGLSIAFVMFTAISFFLILSRFGLDFIESTIIALAIFLLGLTLKRELT